MPERPRLCHVSNIKTISVGEKLNATQMQDFGFENKDDPNTWIPTTKVLKAMCLDFGQDMTKELYPIRCTKTTNHVRITTTQSGDKKIVSSITYNEGGGRSDRSIGSGLMGNSNNNTHNGPRTLEWYPGCVSEPAPRSFTDTTY